MRNRVRIAAEIMMTARVRRPNHEITTQGPLDSAASKRYRARAPTEFLAPARSRTAGFTRGLDSSETLDRPSRFLALPC